MLPWSAERAPFDEIQCSAGARHPSRHLEYVSQLHQRRRQRPQHVRRHWGLAKVCACLSIDLLLLFLCFFLSHFCICCNLWQYDDTEDVVVQTNQSFSSCTFFFAASSTTLLSLRTTSWTRTLEVCKIGTASQAPAHCDQLSPWSDSLLGQLGSAVARLG